MGLTALDNTLGGLVIGSWAASMLWTLEFLEAWKYFRNYYSKDPPLLKFMVGFLLLNSIECMIGNFTYVYLYCVTYWGNTAGIAVQYWPSPNFVVSGAVTAICVQSFLVWRYYALSKNWLGVVILEAFAITSFGGALALSVILITASSIADRDKATTTATIFFCASAGADLAIAIALLWQFQKVNTIFDHTRSLVRSLMFNTMQSGLATASVALFGFALFMVGKQQNWATGVVFVEARVYNLTLLFNLNTRKRRDGSRPGTKSATDIEMDRSAGPRGQTMPNDAISGVHVIRTVNIRGDHDPKIPQTIVEYETDENSLEDRKR